MKRLRWLLAIPLLALLPMGWGFGVEPAQLVVSETTIELGLDQELRVALLTDLHVGSPHMDLDRVAEIVALTNAQEPDLILLAGDYVIDRVLGGTDVPMSDIAPVLGELSAPLGVIGVLGNHDWWNQGPEIAQALSEASIVVLENQALPVTPGLTVVGVGDMTTDHHDPERALLGLEGTQVLVLTHHPDVFPELPDWVGLTLAGHTHGGQVRLPFIGTPGIPSSYGQRYASGVVVEGDKTLVVSKSARGSAPASCRCALGCLRS